MGQFGEEPGALAGFVQRVVTGLAGAGKQFGHGGAVEVGMLALVQRHQEEAEHADRAPQFAQAAPGQQRTAVGVERAGDGAQVGAQLVPVAVGCRLGMAKARVERNVALAGGGGQPCQQGGDGAAVGFFFAADGGIGRAVAQCLHGRADLHPAVGQRQFAVEAFEFVVVMGKGDFGLARQGVAQQVGVDERVAVAVAADPAADAVKVGDFDAGAEGGGDVVFQPAVQGRQGIKEGQRVIGDAVFDFVLDRQLEGADVGRLPERQQYPLELGRQGGFGVGIDIGVVEQLQELADGTLAVQRGLALHFGRMGGQYRHDLGVFQQAGQRVGGDAVFAQDGQRTGQAARLRWRTGLAVRLAAAVVVQVFGEVFQLGQQAAGTQQGVEDDG